MDRIEVSRRYVLRCSAPLGAEAREHFAALVHDRMTEQVYPAPLSSFASDTVPAPVTTIPVVAEGRAALERINKVCMSGVVRLTWLSGPGLPHCHHQALMFSRIPCFMAHAMFAGDGTCI